MLYNMGYYKFLMWCTSCNVDEPVMDVQRRPPPLEFTRGVHEFINVAKANTRNGFMCCHVFYVRMRRIILAQGSFTNTCLRQVSCQTIFVGLRMEKEVL
jgi:hypothetical protein